MSKYITAAVVVIAFIGAGIWYYGRGETPTPTATATVGEGNPVVGGISNDTDHYDVLVTFDGENFNPKEVTVKKGSRVRFLNDSDMEVWPASAVHPTHSIYPEKDAKNCLGSSFDACRALTRGEFFDFTFNYEGEWRYHDHVQAFKTGMVTVTQ